MAWALLLSHGAFAADADLQAVMRGEGAIGYSSGFIRTSVPVDGVVSQLTGDNQTTGNRMLIGMTDLLYLRFRQPEEVAPGDLYTIYRRIREVFHPQHGHYLGDLFENVGIVRVVKSDHDLTTVRVIRSYANISPGDRVIRFAPPPHEEAVSSGRTLSDNPGTIVEVQQPRFLIGQRNVVYVDWGREEGLQLGDRLEVFRVGAGLPSRVIGELKIVALEDTTATGYIVRSTAPLLRGDRFIFKEATTETVRQEEELLKAQREELERLASKSEKVARLPEEPDATRTPTAVQRIGDRLRISLDELVDLVEFDSGEARLKPEGIKILKQVSEILKGVPDKHFRVEGHADNVPIGPSLQEMFPTNWELSKARATSVVRYLIEEGGLDSASVSVVGYGDTRPIASNETEEGRKVNRRVEIVLLPPTPTQPSEEQSLSKPDAGVAPQTPSHGDQPASTPSVTQPPSATVPESAPTPPDRPPDLQPGTLR
ncbi:MAG: OmpA family protein [Nitrospiraceae bacterium]